MKNLTSRNKDRVEIPIFQALNRTVKRNSNKEHPQAGQIKTASGQILKIGGISKKKRTSADCTKPWPTVWLISFSTTNKGFSHGFSRVVRITAYKRSPLSYALRKVGWRSVEKNAVAVEIISAHNQWVSSINRIEKWLDDARRFSALFAFFGDVSLPTPRAPAPCSSSRGDEFRFSLIVSGTP